MATLTVEDGSVVSGANTYASESELTTYCSDRDITLTADYGDATEILIRAMDYIEMLEFSGDKYSKSQELQFPRVGVVVDGYSYVYTDLPPDLKKAQMALAVAIDQGFDPLANVDREQKKVKIGSLEIEYADGAAAIPMAQTFAHRIRKLLGAHSGGSNFAVVR